MNDSHPRLTWSLIGIVGLLTLCPMAMLLLGSFSEGLTAFGKFTTSKYVAAYTDPELLEVILNTLVFVSGASVFGTVLALFLAYLNTRTDIAFKSVFEVLSLIPMMVPHLLFSVSWALLLNPSNGILNLILNEVFGLEDSLFSIYSLTGMIFVGGLLSMPISYLIIAPAMASFAASLEEASYVFGASTWRTFLRITLPILRPAILAALVLSLVQNLASYAVPEVLGMPGNIKVLATYLFEMISIGASPDYGKAAALSMSVLSASIGLIVLYRALTAESGKFVTVSGRGDRIATIPLGRARIPMFLLIALLVLVMIVLPIAVLVYTSLVPYAMVPSLHALSQLSLRHWREVLDDRTSMLALQHSLFLAVAGATIGVVLSALVAYVTVKVRTRASGLLDSLSYLSFAFPGIVIGIGFMWFFVQTPLYATLTALLIGYIATYLPYGVKPIASAFVQLHASLEESSFVSGASLATTMRRIILPLVAPGVIGAWILLATIFVRELTLSVVLARPGSEVLAVKILSFAYDGLWGPLSALGIITILISTGLVLLAKFAGQRLGT